MARRRRRKSTADKFPLWGIVSRRWRWGALAVLCFLVPAASVIAFLPDVYRSKATVLIERQQIPDELVRSTVTSALETRLHTITQEILSRPHIEALASQFGVADEWGKGPPEASVERIRRSIDVELETSKVGRDYSSTAVAFTVAFSSRDARKAAAIANALALSYVEKNLEMRKDEAAGTADFLREQLAATSQRLQQMEKQVSAFKERHTGQLPEQLSANLATLEQLNVQLRLNSENQISARERRAALVKQLNEVEGMAPAGTPDAAGNRLLQLKQTLASLEARYSDKYPDVVRVKAEIQALEAQLRRSGGEGSKTGLVDANPLTFELRRSIDAVDVELTRLRAEQDNLRRSTAQYQQRVELAPRREQEAQAITREYETTKELYRSLVNRERESQLAEDMEQRRKGEQFRIIEPALAPRSPAAPNRRLMIPLLLPFSLALGLAMMLALELGDKAVRSTEEIESIASMRVVARIPPIVSDLEREQQRQRLRVLASAAAGALVVVVGLAYLIARGNWALTNLLLRLS
jgi:polysaccharide chain length determinant protein (PEP-CTERM system associated)